MPGVPMIAARDEGGPVGIPGDREAMYANASGVGGKFDPEEIAQAKMMISRMPKDMLAAIKSMPPEQLMEQLAPLLIQAGIPQDEIADYIELLGLILSGAM